MTVKTVGEMVHGHTFDAMATEWDERSACMAMISQENQATCDRVYGDHMLRPPMPRAKLDSVPMPLDRFGFYMHRDGCATLCEVLGSCTCGMIEGNVSRILWLLESQLATAQQMANWATNGLPSESMPSTEFRTAYAGLEEPTNVTVNGRVIGRWIPVSESDG